MGILNKGTITLLAQDKITLGESERFTQFLCTIVMSFTYIRLKPKQGRQGNLPSIFYPVNLPILRMNR